MLHLFLKAPVYTMHKWTGVGKEMVQKYNSFLTAGPSHRVGSRHCKSHVKTRLGLRRRTPQGTHERIAGIAVPSLYYESYRRNRVEILAAPLKTFAVEVLRGRGHTLFTWIGNKYIKQWKHLSGTTEAAGQLGKDASWEGKKTKKNLNQYSLTTPKGTAELWRKAIYLFRGVHVWNQHIYLHTHTRTKKLLSKKPRGISSVVMTDPATFAFSSTSHPLPLQLKMAKDDKNEMQRMEHSVQMQFVFFVCLLSGSPRFFFFFFCSCTVVVDDFFFSFALFL